MIERGPDQFALSLLGFAAVEFPHRHVRVALCVWLAVALAGSGCNTYFPVNEPLETWPQPGYRALRRWSETRSNELLFVVTFSGGGTRAAAFSYGVLEELRDTKSAFPEQDRSMLDEVDHITGVSGGSFTAAYYGLRGRGIFDDFERRFLTRNVQWSLILQMIWPWNWGMLFSPYFERSDLVAHYYDRILFDGATFADLAAGNGPFVQINGTDLATGSPFSFIQEQFDYLCSDLLQYRVSRAVAASSAVPGPMSPMTLRNYAGRCPFLPPEWIGREIAGGRAFGREYVKAKNLESYLDARRRRFIRVVDGAVSDNLGVRGPFEGALLAPPAGDARPPEFGNLRWVVLVVVNAATSPETSWEEADVSVPLVNLIDQTASVQVNRYNIETLEMLRSSYRRWNAAAATWKDPVGFHLVEVDFARVPDPQQRRQLNQMPTSLALDEEQVDQLRAAARTTLRGSEPWQAFLSSFEPRAAQEIPAPGSDRSAQ